MTNNGLEAARKRGRVGGRRPVVDDDKRAAILARRQRGESIRTIAAGVKISVGVVVAANWTWWYTAKIW